MWRMFLCLAALCLAVSCQMEPQPVLADAEVRVCCVVTVSKSSVPFADDAVRNLNVFAYRDSVLERAAYTESGSVELLLVRGKSYDFYALANVGAVSAPLHERDLPSLSLPVDPGLASTGIPLCTRVPLRAVAGASSGPLVLSPQRLAARVSLRLDKRLERCDFTPLSVRICQAAADLHPFAPESRAAAVAAGDSAAGSDIARLTAGEKAVFYLPENCRGVLLPGNDDPWEKVPDVLDDEEAALCSYLEVNGTWTTKGASAPLCLRLFLGADNCSDFNVRGGTSHELTLTLSDEGTLACNWKVERGSLTEGRTLRFPQSSLTLWQGAAEVALPLSCDPPDQIWRLEAEGGLPDAGLSWRTEGNTLFLSSRYVGLGTPEATLWLRSWDGFLSDRLDVTVRYVPGDFTAYGWDPPVHWMEFGSISFPDVDEAGPVRIRCGGADWLMGSDATPQTAYDAASGVRFYYHPAGKCVYMRPEQTGLAPARILLSRGQQEREVLVPVPRVPAFAPADPVLLETGDRYYDENADRYYDASFRLSLCDAEGNDLDLARFAIPEAWLVARGWVHDAAARYADVLEAFCEGLDVQSPDLGGIWCTEGGAPWYGFTYTSAHACNYSCCTAGNALGIFYLYGLSSGGLDRKSLPWRVCSDSLCMEEGTMTIVAAFPAQRYLGTVINYQVAPGALRRLYTPIDFTDGGRYDAPSAGEIDWDVMHARIDPSLPVVASIASPRYDEYSAGLSVGSDRLSFDPVSTGRYPSCGSFVLTGEGRNPHSGRVVTGLYTLDVVLYLSVGASVCFVRDPKTLNDYIAVCFSPFCENADSAHAGYWESFPASVPVRSWDDGRTQSYVRVPEGLEGRPVLVQGDYPGPGAGTGQRCYSLLGGESRFLAFDFYADGVRTSTLEIGRETTGELAQYADGSKGYYRLVRQYDLRNLSGTADTYGLENYVVEAAFGLWE